MRLFCFIWSWPHLRRAERESFSDMSTTERRAKSWGAHLSLKDTRPYLCANKRHIFIHSDFNRARGVALGGRGSQGCGFLPDYPLSKAAPEVVPGKKWPYEFLGWFHRAPWGECRGVGMQNRITPSVSPKTILPPQCWNPKCPEVAWGISFFQHASCGENSYNYLRKLQSCLLQNNNIALIQFTWIGRGEAAMKGLIETFLLACSLCGRMKPGASHLNLLHHTYHLSFDQFFYCTDKLCSTGDFGSDRTASEQRRGLQGTVW